MLVTPFLDETRFDSEARRVMRLALEMTCIALREHLPNRSDLTADIVAKKIIELAEEGEYNPDRLVERALNNLSQVTTN